MLANDFLVSDFFRITTVSNWAISTQYICVGLQLQQIQELTVVHAGLRPANEFRHPAEGVHHRMHLDAALPPRPSNGFRPTPPQNLAEELDGSTIDDLQVSDAQTL